LKLKLAQHRLDYFKLFKIIDRSSRGVAGAEDLYEYYRWAGGKMHYKPQEFELLIERYAQSDEPWITLTEFCEMVRGEDK
jgi:Ca2+-binding EF-hand superfamily protein